MNEDSGTQAADAAPLQGLGRDLANLIQAETTRLRTELRDSAQESRQAIALFGAAAGLTAVAVGALGATALRALDRVLPREWSGLVATGIFGVGAALAVRQGRTELRKARRSLPPT